MSNYKITIVLAALAALLLQTRATAAGDTDPARILAESDRARGGGLPGIEWSLKVNSTEGEDQELRQLVVIAVNDSSLATTVYPPRMNRAKLLQVEHNMWYGRPDLRKPISISPRQRMSGPAVNGDIAATNYNGEYTPTLVREEKVGEEDTWVLNLVGKNKWVTYDRIVYWVSRKRMVAVKAEFYTVSGKLIKTATFEYNNSVTYDNRTIPFVSRIEIHDAITKDNFAILEYSAVKVRKLTAADFHISVLGG